MAINLIDTRRFEFGSVGWQDAMRHNIREKITIGEELGHAELCFAEVQHMHNINHGLYKCMDRKNLLKGNNKNNPWEDPDIQSKTRAGAD